MSTDQEPGSSTGFMGLMARQWKRLPSGFRWNLEDTFQPEDMGERLLPGEVVQIVIHLAWYRDIIGLLVFDYFRYFLAGTILTSVLIFSLGVIQGFSLWYATLPTVILIGLAATAVRERVEHRQWRLVKTNARFIISIPQHGAFPLVDNIELKGMPSVLDTNWSPNPFWRLFQFTTGARDLYISLTAYKFVEGTARVGDALIIPDVMPDDVYELRKLVFKPPIPTKVIFPTPQEVIVLED